MASRRNVEFKTTPRLIQIEKLVNTLQGGKDEHFHQVFGEQSFLLPLFLNAGIAENVNLSGKKKRKRTEQPEDDGNDVDDDTNDHLI